jgi:LuxR family transcriptional regulator of spore coat protein
VAVDEVAQQGKGAAALFLFLTAQFFLYSHVNLTKYIRWDDGFPSPSLDFEGRQGGGRHVSDTQPKFRRFLSNREREVFELLVQNKTTKEIAAQLFISEKTVRNHISNVMQKLQVKGRSQAVVELIRLEELKI